MCMCVCLWILSLGICYRKCFDDDSSNRPLQPQLQAAGNEQAQAVAVVVVEVEDEDSETDDEWWHIGKKLNEMWNLISTPTATIISNTLSLCVCVCFETRTITGWSIHPQLNEKFHFFSAFLKY